MFRKLLKLVLVSFGIWLLSVIGLVAIFTFVPNPSPQLLPIALGWMVAMSILWLVVLVRQLLKWRTDKSVGLQ